MTSPAGGGWRRREDSDARLISRPSDVKLRSFNTKVSRLFLPRPPFRRARAVRAFVPLQLPHHPCPEIQQQVWDCSFLAHAASIGDFPV